MEKSHFVNNDNNTNAHRHTHVVFAASLSDVNSDVTVEQHPLVVMVVVLICDLLLPVGVTLPQLLVHHLLNLWTHIM